MWIYTVWSDRLRTSILGQEHTHAEGIYLLTPKVQTPDVSKLQRTNVKIKPEQQATKRGLRVLRSKLTECALTHAQPINLYRGRRRVTNAANDCKSMSESLANIQMISKQPQNRTFNSVRARGILWTDYVSPSGLTFKPQQRRRRTRKQQDARTAPKRHVLS